VDITKQIEVIIMIKILIKEKTIGNRKEINKMMGQKNIINRKTEIFRMKKFRLKKLQSLQV
jgi:hypothetical protein